MVDSVTNKIPCTGKKKKVNALEGAKYFSMPCNLP